MTHQRLADGVEYIIRGSARASDKHVDSANLVLDFPRQTLDLVSVEQVAAIGKSRQLNLGFVFAVLGPDALYPRLIPPDPRHGNFHRRQIAIDADHRASTFREFLGQ